jgi:MFS transporter, DHA2 family, multidrug resistance protein
MSAVVAAPSAPVFPPTPTKIPWLGLLAVLLGTFISTLNGRLSSFGLADIRGAVGAGFDEGAWITTAQTVAQMSVTLAAIGLGAIFGPRRVLIAASISFAVISLITPFAKTLSWLLVLQFMGGASSGFFIPLTLSFVLLNTPPKYWAYGIAIYALNLELSLNISASLEGWYVEHHSWRWIFWQNVPLALGMSLCLHRGLKSTPLPPTRPKLDVFAVVLGGAGLGLIYAALDQGNRLDWLNSGLVCGLLLGGLVLMGAFFVHEARSPHPLINLRVVFARPLPKILVLIAFLRLTILATAYLIPLYLGSVRAFRALEVGQTLIWIAVPQLLLCYLAALMLRRTDPRLVSCIGFIFISVACLTVGYSLTPIWGSDQFLPSQLLQAVGQSFALSGVIFFGILHLKPQDALTFGAAIQTARLMGGEVGTAFITTFTRVRGQVASNLIGQHVQSGDARVIQRLQAYGAATSRIIDPSGAAGRSATVLSGVVRSMATTQAVIDSFIAVGFLTAIAVLLVVSHKAAPLGPASAAPLFTSKPTLT